MTTRCYHLITNPGLEDAVVSELLRHPEAALFSYPTTSLPGVAEASGAGTSRDAEIAVLASLRTIYHAVEIRGEHTLSQEAMSSSTRFLEEITNIVTAARWPELSAGQSLAVRCQRTGTHPLRSPDIEREVGSVLVSAYAAPVNLGDPEITIRVDLTERSLSVGVLVTPAEMDRRYHWIYRPRVTLSPVVAAALLHWDHRSETPTQTGAILDPFCGSGTIPLEAADQQRLGLLPLVPVFGGDNNCEAIAGARANLWWNNLFGEAALRWTDSTSIDQFSRAWGDRGITRIIANPPFGVRLGKHIHFDRFYDQFLSAAAAVLPREGSITMLSSRRRGALNRVLQHQQRWSVPRVQMIQLGGVHVGVFQIYRRR